MVERRLLVIEDDPRIARLVCHAAEAAGFIALTATGPRAIEKVYGNLQPDVIILDLHMPDMDGIEVLQFLHQQFSRAYRDPQRQRRFIP